MAVSRRSVLTLGGLSLAGFVAGCTGSPRPERPTTSGPATTSTRTPAPNPTGWQPTVVTTSRTGGLSYATAGPLRIPDFGHAGYRGGREPIAEIPVVERIGPAPGDNTARIQAAIDRVGSRPLGPTGFRGALTLAAGRYEIRGTLRQRHTGVVIRGAGDGDDPATSTILHATGNAPPNRTVLEVGGPATWDGQRARTRTDITTDVVPLGAATFDIADGSALRPGDTVIVVHPCTKEWLQAVDGGGTAGDPAWAVGSVPIVHNRRITDVTSGRISLDAPLFSVLDRSLSPCYLYAWNRVGLVTDVGVEDLRIDIEAASPQDERHARHAIRLRGVEDAWVRRCTALRFVQSGVVTTTATRVTVADCRAIEPASKVEGGRRYNFDAEARSQQVLFTRCHAQGGRHSFVVNGASTASGIVFHRTTAEGSLASSEGHRRWSQGLLFDNHTEVAPRTDRVVFLGNRGDYGTGHGWSTVNSFAWAVDSAGKEVVVQQPPTAQNWAIGCLGTVTGTGPFPGREGQVEGTGRRGVEPPSLYDAQLADRSH